MLCGAGVLQQQSMRKFIGAVCFAIIVAVTTASVQAAAPVFPLDGTTSPNGIYALALGGVSPVAHSESRPINESDLPNTGVFLVKLKPLQTIREIGKSIRDFSPHPENNYECYWQRNSSMVGVVYLRKGGSTLKIIQNRLRKWRDLQLPDFNPRNYGAKLASHFSIENPQIIHAPIEFVSLDAHAIHVRVVTEVLSNNKNVNFTINYFYSKRGGNWRLRQVTSDIEK